MSRKDGFYRINLASTEKPHWTISWWNSSTQTFRVGKFDYRADEVTKIDPPIVDPTPESERIHNENVQG